MAIQSKSKITVAGTRTQVQALLAHAHSPTHKRNFLETVDLQFNLTNYDPARDKRLSGSVKLPSVPRPHMTVCVLGDQHDLDRARRHGVDSLSFDDLKKLNKNKKLVKKLARRYDAFVCSETRLREIPRVLGPSLSRAGKFPTPVSHRDDLAARIVDVKSTVRFGLRRELNMAMAIGNVDMTAEQLVANIMITINYLVSCLKKGWSNVNSIVIKSTMSPPHPLF
ncbi:ribosomal protein L1-like protein [Cercophora samala]|uniref:Ribosomal protein L1-like protein n=1 Tax=Cercophora samala TaxID=330535 RepID=A0AA40D7H3_9PEZI|nr:ribosomal protein L1-like protein [Cercophora samala]